MTGHVALAVSNLADYRAGATPKDGDGDGPPAASDLDARMECAHLATQAYLATLACPGLDPASVTWDEFFQNIVARVFGAEVED